ncbi:MAG: hypothetical protein AAB943_00850 [Patescibacteria group bacterium]
MMISFVAGFLALVRWSGVIASLFLGFTLYQVTGRSDRRIILRSMLAMIPVALAWSFIPTEQARKVVGFWAAGIMLAISVGIKVYSYLSARFGKNPR